MKVALKELFCVEWELDRQIVLDSEHAFSIKAYIGPMDTDISECFTITVCNGRYVQSQIAKQGYFSNLWHLIVEEPTYEIVKNYFDDQLSLLSGQKWEHFFSKLRLIGKSEFEDYQELN